MLIYHPAYDAYHCVFRALLITKLIPKMELSRLRILDFFLCFPGEIRNVRLPQSQSETRKVAKNLVNEYHGPVNVRHTFRDMQHLQYAAFRSLAASGLFDAKEFELGLVSRTDASIPDELSRTISATRERDKVAIRCVVDVLGVMPLNGVDGLKARTGLMEHRYDAA